jgi:hypothetical protein
MSKSKKPITPSKWCYQPGKTVISPFWIKNIVFLLSVIKGCTCNLLYMGIP